MEHGKTQKGYSTAGLLHWIALYNEGAYVFVFTCVSAGCSCG